MKKIKILSAIMALAMMMTTFASCGQVDEEPIDGDATVATTTLGNVTTTVETDEVVLTTTSGSSTTTRNTTTTSKTSTTTKKSSTTTTTTSKSSSATTTTRENNNNWTTTNFSPDPVPQQQPSYTEAPRHLKLVQQLLQRNRLQSQQQLQLRLQNPQRFTLDVMKKQV